MSVRKAAAGLVCLSVAVAAFSSVYFDKMIPVAGKSAMALAGSNWSASWEGKNAVPPMQPYHTQMVYPEPLAKLYHWDLLNDAQPSTGMCLYIAGRIGNPPPVDGKVVKPYLSLSAYWTNKKIGTASPYTVDTLNLNKMGVDSIAMLARGKGIWQVRIKSALAADLSVRLGKDRGDLDYRADFAGMLDPTTFKWIRFKKSDFMPSEAKFQRLLIDTLGKCASPQDCGRLAFEDTYQLKLNTNYQGGSQDSGSLAWLQVKEIVLIGSITQIGLANQTNGAVSASKMMEISAGAASGVVARQSPRAGLRVDQSTRYYTTDGRIVKGIRHAGRVVLPRGVYISRTMQNRSAVTGSVVVH